MQPLALALLAVSAAVRFDIRLTGSDQTDLSQVEVSVVSSTDGKPTAQVRALGLGRHSILVPDGGLPVTVTCKAERAWCPSVEVKDAGVAVNLPIFRAVKLDVPLILPAGLTPPKVVRVQGILHGERDLQLVAEASIHRGLVSIQVPAVEDLDLRIAADGLTPAYLFGVSTAKPVALPRLRLFRGGSVSGFVRDEATKQPLESIEARLAPAGPVPISGAPDQRAEQWQLQSFRTSTSHRGFFQFPGVGPGRYRLDLAGPLHPPASAMVEVAEAAETHLEEIVLGSFVRLDVVVSPPVGPDGQRWTVSVLPEASRERRPVSDRASASGVARFARVPPGNVEVTVASAGGDRLAVQEEEVSKSRRIEIKVPIVKVRGSVRRRTTPVTGARIIIETGSGDRAAFATDIDGQFEGMMRAPDQVIPTISVDIEEGDRDPISLTYDLPDPASNPLEIAVDLGDVRLPGTVLDNAGAPAGGALVWAESADLKYHVRVKSDEEGHFEILGVPIGTLYLRATHERGTAPRQELTNVDAENGPALLRLQPWKELRGAVISGTNAPVSGAELRVMTDAGEDRRTRTSASGDFTVQVSAATQQIVAKVFAPQQLLWSACLRLPEGGKVALRLPPLPGGTLTLATNPPQGKTAAVTPGPTREPFLITEIGGLLGTGDLVAWRRMVTGQPGSPRAVPGLPAQAYGVVWSHYDPGMLVRGACSGQLAAEADWHYLAAGGELTIDVAPRPE
jgi:hypothetical protein